jgi:hypothetical protein
LSLLESNLAFTLVETETTKQPEIHESKLGGGTMIVASVPIPCPMPGGEAGDEIATLFPGLGEAVGMKFRKLWRPLLVRNRRNILCFHRG